MAQFAIVLTAEGDTWEHLGEVEQQRLLGRYEEWVAGLRSRGAYRDGSATGSADTVQPDGTTSPATGPLLTGLFTIEAADRAEAVALAAGCPAFEHGETVIVYELT